MNNLLINNISFHDFAQGLARVLEAKDIYTAGHSERVAHLALEISKVMGLDENQQEFIHIAGHLHDIGKIGIPDGILLKTGKLTQSEYFVMQQHSQIGAGVFSYMPQYKKMKDIICYHHERYDGKGYPEGLKGNEIPIGAAIIAVADTYDAMTTTRSYRTFVDKHKAVEEIINNMGTQFNPEVVNAFEKIYSHNSQFLDNIFKCASPLKKAMEYKPFNSIKK